jgi:hypothetical protein
LSNWVWRDRLKAPVQRAPNVPVLKSCCVGEARPAPPQTGLLHLKSSQRPLLLAFEILMLGSAAPEGLCLEPEQSPPEGEMHERHDVSRGGRTGFGRAGALKEFLNGFGKGTA